MPRHISRPGPDLGCQPLGRRRQPVDAARLHAGPEPGRPSGTSAFGRWMYGPWFWPPAKDVKYPPIANPYYDPACDPNVAAFCEPALIPSTPNISVGMEAFNDTPVVNGTAYPRPPSDPKAYRFRILNAANDRFWNLQWYVADPTTGTLSEVALKPAEVAAAQLDPNVFPTPDLTRALPGRAGSRSAPRAASCRPRWSSRTSPSPGSRSDPLQRRQRGPALAAPRAGRAR